MKVIWNIAKKDLRLLLRDPKAAIILLLMPLAFILVLGISLAEDKIRVSIVNHDNGRWSAQVMKDLKQTAGIDVEELTDVAEAERLVATNRRAAVFIFGENFTERVERCSFLAEGVNPFYRDGVDVSALDARILRDETQLMSASIIEQVAQGTLLRVVLPWMIGQAFSEIGEPEFIDRLSKRRELVLLGASTVGLLGGAGGENQWTMAASLYPERFRTELDVELPFRKLIEQMGEDDNFTKVRILFLDVKTAFKGLREPQKQQLAAVMKESFTMAKVLRMFDDKQKASLAVGLQDTLQELFPKYDLTAKDWVHLTKSSPHAGDNETLAKVNQIIGRGFLRRGAIRYQKLVPSYIVMFAFFLVLTGGWLFVAERRQGTLKRLNVAPISRGQILLGKLLPILLVSVTQGLFLLLAGKFVFNMSWGPQPWWLLLVVLTTSFAAMGMALLVASLAKTETQVAIYGTLLVLLLAGLSGALMGDRAMMPETMEQISRITPHAWALDAYQQLLIPPGDLGAAREPNVAIVAWSCVVLAGFGLLFLALSWFSFRMT